MKIKLLTIGKTDSRPLQQLIDEYCKRLGFYIPFNMDIIPDIKNTKNLTTKQQKLFFLDHCSSFFEEMLKIELSYKVFHFHRVK